MKKKNPNISPAAQAESDSRREYMNFSKAAGTEAPALGGIALRAIMSDIPKQKSMCGRAQEIVAKTKKI